MMMSAWKNRLFRFLVALIAGLGAAVAWNSPSEAYVQLLVIDATNTANYYPAPLGSSIGSTTPVSYTIYTGRIFGQLNPSLPQNTVITDLGLASPITANGVNYSYIANFEIVTPTNPAQRDGLLLYEVSNRGSAPIPTNTTPGAATTLVAGVTYVESGWQGDLLSQCAGISPVPLYPCVSLTNTTPGFGGAGGGYGTATANYPFFAPPANIGTGTDDMVIQVPVATTDGNPPNGSNTITGQVYGHIQAPIAANQHTGQLIIYSTPYVPFQPSGYSPANPGGTLSTAGVNFWFDTAQSTDGVDTGVTTIPNNQWTWANCPNGPPGTPNPYYICLASGTFNTNDLYEMVFAAQNPLVQGVGWAATRDLVSFLRYGTTAPGGGTNPIAGTVTKGMIQGVSQSGAFDRSFVFYGFNQDESSRIVFDGDWVIISGRILWMMPRWSQPNVLSDLYMGGQEAPIWWADFPNQARGLPAAGMLDRCNATTPNTCPQVLETWGGNEYYINKMAADFVGYCTTCTSEIPQPPNVYRYYTAGATHGGGTISFSWTSPASITVPFSSSAMYPTSPIPESYTNNALEYAFIGLLGCNPTCGSPSIPMPPSGPGISYPSFAQGQLAPSTNQAAVGFPNIPGVPYGANQAWPPFVYNFGPDENYTQQSGVPTIEPPTIANLVPGQCPTGVCTAWIPTTNSDGNDNGGGLPSVLFQAPLATYMDWNIIPSGPYIGQAVELNAGYWPFWDTKANRTAHSDPRPSLEERYGTHTGYGCVVSQAIVSAEEQRFLLPSDAQIVKTDFTTQSTTVLPAPFTPSTADISLSHNVLCGLTATHDFNGDYKSDVLWRDLSGNVGMWLMNGTTITTAKVLGNVPGTWSIVGQRDFNGDGNADVLWRDSAGNVGIWLMNGTSITSTAVLGNVPINWSVAATGNFDGTGFGDIVWRDTSGNVGLWFMNGTTIAKTAVVGNVPTNWVIAGADNHGDIFWRNVVTGEAGMWVMNGATVAKSVDFGVVPLSWSIAGIGDFDGNGSTDILWRDTSGNVGMWLMNGTSVASTSVLGNVPLNWTIAQTGDYSGAGMSDILWLDNAGNVGVWFMNGAAISSTFIYGNVGTSWSVQSQGAD